ncbi:MAG: fluoride efflux transporter CrcB [Alphaproteobacteria bacterium]|nr:fluoride efflux transporter CrcB [Alphaproteobacteria bacterium]
MHPIFLVMTGGALGAAARYLAASAIGLRGDWPMGTFLVNLAGGLLMGMLAALVLRGTASESVRLFMGVGILGGFTTFSAFSLEGFNMIARGQWALAIGYAFASVIGSIVALAIGYGVARA